MKLPDDFDIDSLPVIGEGAAQAPQAQSAPSATGSQSRQQPSADLDLDSLPELPRIPTAEEKRAQFEEWKRRRDAAQAAVPEERRPGARGFLGDVARGMFTTEGMREAAEDSWTAKPYAYMNDLANSIVSGFLGGGAKIEEAAGRIAGDNAVGRALVNDAQAGQDMLERNLQTNALDTSGGGVVNKALDVGKGVAHVTGEFAPAAIPGVGQAYAATTVSAGSVNRYGQVKEAAKASGYSDAQAEAWATGAGALDALQNILLMKGFRGIWGGGQKAAADAAKQSLVKKLMVDTVKTGAIGSGGGMAQDVVNQNVGIDQNGQVGEVRPYDWTRTAKVGVDQFFEFGAFHLVNTAAHAMPKALAWESSPRTMSARLARKALDAPEGRALVMCNNPEAAKKILEARKNGKDVSRRMLEELGIPSEVAPSKGDRNALADSVAEDYRTWKDWQKTLPDKQQSAALDAEIAGVGAEGESASLIREGVLSRIKDAKELDDPKRRADLVYEAANGLLGDTTGIGGNRLEPMDNPVDKAMQERFAAQDKEAARTQNKAAREAKRTAKAEEAADAARAEQERLQAEAEQEAAIKERAEQVAKEGARPNAAVEEMKAAEAENAEPRPRTEEYPEYAEWLAKNGMKDIDKNWNKFVAKNDMDPSLKVGQTEGEVPNTSGQGGHGSYTPKLDAERQRIAEKKAAAKEAERIDHETKIGEKALEAKKAQQAEMEEYERQEAERKRREAEFENRPIITVGREDTTTKIAQPPTPDERLSQYPEYAEWIGKNGRKNNDKNWRKFVMENGLDPALIPQGEIKKPGAPPSGGKPTEPPKPKAKEPPTAEPPKNGPTIAPREEGTTTPPNGEEPPQGGKTAENGTEGRSASADTIGGEPPAPTVPHSTPAPEPKKPFGKGDPSHGQGKYSRKNYDSDAANTGSTGAATWHWQNGERVYSLPVDLSQTRPGGPVVLDKTDSAYERIRELLNGRQLVMTKSGKIQFKGEFKGAVPKELRELLGRELKIGKNPDAPSKDDLYSVNKGQFGEETRTTWEEVDRAVAADRENYHNWQKRRQRADRRASEEKKLEKKVKSGKATQNELDILRHRNMMEDYLDQGGKETDADYKAMERDLEVLQESGTYDYEGLSKAKDAADRFRDAEWENAIGDIESGEGDFSPSDQYVKPFTSENLQGAKKGDIIHFDHDEVKYELDRYDPETGVMEVYRSDENGVKRRFKVSRNGVEEIRNDGKGQKGVVQDNAGDAGGGGRPAPGAAGGEAGGAEGAAGRGAGRGKATKKVDVPAFLKAQREAEADGDFEGHRGLADLVESLPPEKAKKLVSLWSESDRLDNEADKLIDEHSRLSRTNQTKFDSSENERKHNDLRARARDLQNEAHNMLLREAEANGWEQGEDAETGGVRWFKKPAEGSAEAREPADLTLESLTPEQQRAERERIAQQQQTAAQKAEMEERRTATLKGGTGDLGQQTLDLGGAEGEQDLFNRREGSPSAQGENPLKPSPKKKPLVGKNARFGWENGREVEIDPSGTPTEKNPLGQIVAPEDGSVAQSIDAEIAADEARAAKGKGKPLGAPPAPAPGSPGNATLNPHYEPESLGAGIKNPVARQEIVDEFKSLFGDTVAIRGKNTTPIGKNFAGHYEPDAGIVRTKNPVSLDTIPHEVGHHIEELTKRLGLARPPNVRAELIALGKKLYNNPKQKPAGGYEAEGFAELMKYYMQGNDAGLKKEVPEAYKWLIDKFGKADPDTMAKVDAIRDMIDRLQNQSPYQAIAGMRVRKPGIGKRMVESVARFISETHLDQESWTDQNAFIKKSMKEAGLDTLFDWQGALKRGDVAAMNDMAENDPRIKAYLYEGSSGARVMFAYENGLTDFAASRRLTYGDLGIQTKGHKANEPLPYPAEIFADFTAKERDAFKLYAIARVAKELYLDKGIPFGLTKSEVNRFLAQHGNNPKFADALERYTHFKHGVLHLLVDAGAMSQQQFEAIVAENPIYVKISRHRELADAFLNRMANRRGGAVNRRKGGSQQIENIFDAGMVDDERVIAAALQADLLRSIVGAGKRGEKAGGVAAGIYTGANWLREVPNAQGEVKFTSEKLRKQITDAMLSSGVATDKAGAKTIFDQLFNGGNDTLSIFKEKPSNGKNGLVSIYDESGKLHTYELPENNAEGWARGLMGFTDTKRANEFEKIISIGASTVRSGATTLNATFMLGNLVNDTFQTAVMNEYGLYVPVLSTAHGLYSDLMGTKPKQIYDAMGLGLGTMLGRAKLVDAKRANRYLYSKNWFSRQWNKGITKMVADFVGITENMNRVESLSKCRDYMLAHGATDKAANLIAACNALDNTLNFKRGGSAAKAINRWVPFFNAGIQGIAQLSRKLGITKAEPWQLNQSKPKIAMRTVAQGVTWLTSFAIMAELFNRSDDERKRKADDLPPHEKWNFMSFGDIRIPIARELGYIFASIPKAVFEQMYDGHEGAVADCLKMGFKTLPNLNPRSIALIGPWFGTMMNEYWHGSKIIPDHVMESKQPWQWYTDRTHEFSKLLGKAMYKMFGDDAGKLASPAHLEAFFNETTGNMYGNVLDLIDGKQKIDPERPHTWPVVRKFFRDPTVSRVMSDFYDRRKELTRMKGSGVASKAELKELEGADKIAKDFTELRKKADRIRADKTLTVTGRNDRLEKITKAMQERVRKFDAYWKERRKK